ncbi:hypothetical protein FRC09_005792 [Ceratobasidium sp. 395]|nr:hypothetical protein FRC09_005792 [Ceratobasidium sp. 395]
MLIPFSVDFPDEGQDETEKETEKSNEDTKPAFVKDALAWLILNSQDSNSIDVAIGALVVGKVGLELDRSLQSRINSHLVKHFSGSFYSSGDGVKLQLQSPENSRQSVLDYVNWMSYFARDSIEHIAPQILRFEESFKLDTVTQLGLALACLAQDKQLPRDTGRKVALWLSSFIKNYNENALYFNPEVLSAMIDGLTATSFHCRLSANGQNTAQNSGTSQNRLQYLAISDLTDILWKVSLEKGSPLRASIGVNLAVFALTSNLIYPFDNKNFQSAAYSLAFDYGSTDARDEKFISFLLFAVLGILHPLNRIDLSQNTVATMCSLIQETRYLDQAGFAVSLPYLEDLGPVKLKRCLTAMLIEIMVQPRAPTTPPDFSSIVLWFTALHISTSPIFSLEEFRQFEQMVERIFTLPAGLHRICALICVYAQHEDTHLKEGALIASMDLLYEQVKTLSGLDFTIIEGKVFPQISSDVGALEPAAKDVGHLSTSETLTPASSPTNSHIDALGKTSPEQIASHTLALVLKRSNDKQCIEIAVRAILLHSNKCSVELVMKATRWFEDRLINISPTDEATASGRILNLSGYIRILTSMALHCPDRAELSKHLNPNASNITERHTYLAVDAKIES